MICVIVANLVNFSLRLHNVWFMPFGQSVECRIDVECQIFFIAIFFNCGQVLQFMAYSMYYKGALTQKRSFLVICTTYVHVG